MQLCLFHLLQVTRSQIQQAMAVSDAISLDDDLATTTSEGDGSLDTILRQLQAEKVSMDRKVAHKRHTAAVPLAEPEDFLEDGGNLTEDDVPTVPTSEGVTPDDHVFLDDPGGGHKNDNGAQQEVDTVEQTLTLQHTQAAAVNGPFDIDHIMDVNGNGTTKSRRWIELKMKALEESNGLDELDEVDPEADYDMLDFAENYYNVHIHNTGYSGALTKTVNMVRRRSLGVSIPLHNYTIYSRG